MRQGPSEEPARLVFELKTTDTSQSDPGKLDSLERAREDSSSKLIVRTRHGQLGAGLYLA